MDGSIDRRGSARESASRRRRRAWEPRSFVRVVRSLAFVRWRRERGRDARATGDGNDPIETRVLERTRVGDGDARDERDGDGGGDERGNGSKAVDVVREGDAGGEAGSADETAAMATEVAAA